MISKTGRRIAGGFGPMSAALLSSSMALGADADTTDDLPDGLSGEVVGPGASRIVSDDAGARFLPVTGESSRVERHRILAGTDGNVWVFGPRSFYRLGQPERHRYWKVDHPRVDAYPSDVVIAPNGRVLATGAWFGGDDREAQLRAYDGKRWRTIRRPPGNHEFQSIRVAPDGTIWGVSTDPDKVRTLVHRRDRSGWSTIRPPERDGSTFGQRARADKTYYFWGWDLALDGKGGFWLGGYWDYPPGGRNHLRTQGLLHYDGQAWETWDLEMYNEDEPRVFDSAINGVPYVGSDWFVDGRWTPVDEVDGQTFGCGHSCSAFVSGADDTLWWPRRYLEGLCVTSFDVAPDSSVWALSGAPPSPRPEQAPIEISVDAYVIDPSTGGAGS